MPEKTDADQRREHGAFVQRYLERYPESPKYAQALADRQFYGQQMRDLVIDECGGDRDRARQSPKWPLYMKGLQQAKAAVTRIERRGVVLADKDRTPTRLNYAWYELLTLTQKEYSKAKATRIAYLGGPKRAMRGGWERALGRWHVWPVSRIAESLGRTKRNVQQYMRGMGLASRPKDYSNSQYMVASIAYMKAQEAVHLHGCVGSEAVHWVRKDMGITPVEAAYYIQAIEHFNEHYPDAGARDPEVLWGGQGYYLFYPEDAMQKVTLDDREFQPFQQPLDTLDVLQPKA